MKCEHIAILATVPKSSGILPEIRSQWVARLCKPHLNVGNSGAFLGGSLVSLESWVGGWGRLANMHIALFYATTLFAAVTMQQQHGAGDFQPQVCKHAADRRKQGLE